MLKRYMHDIVIAIEAITSNKLKSMLTALGIIFGVAAVISMLAIGNGAQQEIIEQIKMVGVNNIVIVPVTPNDKETQSSDDESQARKFSPGLTLADANAIRKLIPGVENISPEVSFNSSLQYNGVRYSARVQGVSIDYFKLYNLPLETGDYFNAEQDRYGIPVCIIGSNVRAKFFNEIEPIGKRIKFGNIWLKVVGVLKKTDITVSSFDNAGVNVYNDNIFVPITTVLMRYRNRALINKIISTNPTQETNYNQLDRIIVQMENTEMLNSTTEVLSRMMIRRHLGVKDYEITVPEMLLKQQQRTKDVFNIVLGAIAGISLLVGGIGIMNIMFASVMERIKEIGTRLAIGAKKSDIVAQFLSEAILISVSGGLIGVILGVILSYLITSIFDIKTIVSLISVVLAFGISAAVGVIFGYAPAKKASERDPIESLRYE
ncbi:MAG: ABC transporter permease [Prevotellaceae bacterium]|jgi:putative ABC transport system permease protein|nr:ABC transporter permease [Prevotellaceae bacterium]